MRLTDSYLPLGGPTHAHLFASPLDKMMCKTFARSLKVFFFDCAKSFHVKGTRPHARQRLVCTVRSRSMHVCLYRRFQERKYQLLTPVACLLSFCFACRQARRVPCTIWGNCEETVRLAGVNSSPVARAAVFAKRSS
jgi:hypothetical protein